MRKSHLALISEMCVHFGSTDDWEKYKTGITTTGEFFKILKFFLLNIDLVDFSNVNIQKINLISTWLTCEKYCRNVVGTDSIYQMPDEPNKFQIYLNKTNGKSFAKSKSHIKGKFVLNYKIEGVCG